MIVWAPDFPVWGGPWLLGSPSGYATAKTPHLNGPNDIYEILRASFLKHFKKHFERKKLYLTPIHIRYVKSLENQVIAPVYTSFYRVYRIQLISLTSRHALYFIPPLLCLHVTIYACYTRFLLT